MNDFNFNFTNKIVLVLGGSRGIGKCLVEQLRKYGSLVYYTYNTSITNDKFSYYYNANNPESIVKIYKTLENKNKIPNFVINNLGIGSSDKINDITLEKWRKVSRINTESYFLSCKEAIRLMKKYNVKNGRIINLSSIAGRNKSLTAGVDYTSSKYAIIGLTKQLAQEISNSGITINVVCPSHTKTDMIKGLSNKKIKEIENQIPLKRLAEPIDIVKPILFLCSSLSSYMTGSCLDINGGQL